MKVNCDVGEGLDDIDALLLPQIDMASIACGGHAGTKESMQRTVAIATQYNVAIGAHPSYPDQENFGRLSLKISPEALHTSLQNQVRSLISIADNQGAKVEFIKPHGALYNDCVHNPEVRKVVLALGVQFNLPLVLQALPECNEHSLYHADIAQINPPTLFEAFADRTYQPNGQLVSRSQPNALLTSKQAVEKRVKLLLENSEIEAEHEAESESDIKSFQATSIPLKVDTLCVHSDSTNAVDMILAIKAVIQRYTTP